MSAAIPVERDALGKTVLIGEHHEIAATVEEVIWARGMSSPFFLVEYWHQGQLVSCRVHAEDCR